MTIERIAHCRLETPDGPVKIGVHHKGDPQRATYLSIDAWGTRIEVGPFAAAHLADALGELSKAIPLGNSLKRAPKEYQMELPDSLNLDGFNPV